jgi:hypothetical protein
MTPTAKLRFIQRDGPMMGFHKNSDGSETTTHQKIRILQQWWAVERDGQITPTGEWRDVPLEAEA